MTEFNPILNDTHFHFFCNQLNKLNFQKKKNRTDATCNPQIKQPWGLSIDLVCLTACNRVFLVNLDVNFAFTMAEKEEQRQCIVVKSHFR